MKLSIIFHVPSSFICYYKNGQYPITSSLILPSCPFLSAAKELIRLRPGICPSLEISHIKIKGVNRGAVALKSTVCSGSPRRAIKIEKVIFLLSFFG